MFTLYLNYNFNIIYTMKKVKIKNAKTLKDIENHPLLGSFWTEENEDAETGYSYWGYLKAGWQSYNNRQHLIHEETVKGFCNVLNSVTRWEDDEELEENQK